MGRGRPRRDLRRPAAPVLRPRPLERAGPHPQGARVRPHQQRGEPRRGRQGVLLLPRLDADPLVHEVPLQVPAARVPLPGPPGDEPAADAGGARVRARRHGGLRRRPVLRRLPRVRQGGPGRHPDPGVGPQPRARRRPGCSSSRRCGSGTPGRGETRETKPVLREKGGAIVASHPELGEYTLSCGGAPELLFTENETNAQRLWGQPNPTPYVKDAFHRYVIAGERGRGEPREDRDEGRGALRPRGAGGRLRGRPSSACARARPREPFGAAFEETLRQRLFDADEFYDRITPRSLGEDERRVHRQALAGMLWTKQYYYFDLDRWLKEHQAHPLLGGAGRGVRNAEWFHMLNGDVISMPDKWEYPWYAAWDLAFHTIALSLVDFDFAKEQLLLMLRSLYSHPNGQMPAYEWNFSDVNPPVHAWATLFLYKFEKNLGREDIQFLAALVPGPDAQLQLVGEPEGPAGTERLRRRVPGPRQHRRLRPQRPAPHRRVARAGGRHGLDGLLLPEHAGDGPHPRRPRPGLRGDRLQVPRELHLDLLRHGQGRRAPGRHVGRGGRLLLRRPPAAGRRGVPAEGPLDGRAAAALREHGVRGGHR